VAEPPQQSIDPSFPVPFSAEIKGRSFTDDLRLDLGGATRKFAREVDLCVREIEVVRYRRCPPIPPDWTRHDVFRYLRARKGDLEKAVLMIEQHLVWKKSFSEPVPAGSPLVERQNVTSEQKLIGIGKMNAAIREERERNGKKNINIPVEIVCDEGKRVVAADLEASLRDAYMQGWAGVDNDGRPIYVEQLGKIDKAKVAQLFDVEKLEWMLYLQQEHTRKLKYLAVSEKQKKPIYQNTVLLDLKGGALRLANSKVCRDMVKLLARVNADNYPESCARILIVGAPFGFETAWAVLKRFLDPVVAEKVIIRKRVEDVFQFADRSQLPAFLGGDLSDDQIADDFHPNHPWMKPEFLEKLAKKNGDLAKCWEEVLAEIEGPRDPIQRGPRAGGQGPLHPGKTEADASRPAGMKEAGGLAASKSTSSSSTTILGPKSSSGASATTSTTKGSGGSTTTMLGSLATSSSTAASTSSTAAMPGPGKSGEIATGEVVVSLPSEPRDLNLRQPQSKCAGAAAVSGFLDPVEDGEVTPETAASTQQSGEDVDVEEVVGSHAGGRFSPTSTAAHPRIEGDEESVAPTGEAGSKLWLCMLKPFELCRSKRRIRNS